MRGAGRAPPPRMLSSAYCASALSARGKMVSWKRRDCWLTARAKAIGLIAISYLPKGAVRNTPADTLLSACPGLPFAGLSSTEMLLHRVNETRCSLPGFLRILSRGGLEHPVVGRLAEFESLVEVPR